MKISLCQINSRVGDFTKNTQKILDCSLKSVEYDAQIVVFPELAVSSYPPLDLLDSKQFIQKNEQALHGLIASFNGSLVPKLKEKKQSLFAVVLGAITENTTKRGKALYNSAVVLEFKNEGFFPIHIQNKRLLPTYDVFDEARYFEPGVKSNPWIFGDYKIGLTVCEDVWFGDQYDDDPAEDLKDCDFQINISASPFDVTKDEKRRVQLRRFAEITKSPMIYVNQVGANDEILFDGRSQVVSETGDELFSLPQFWEGLSVFDLKSRKDVVSDPQFDPKSFIKDPQELIAKALTTGIKDYFQKTGFKTAVIGLSGGIDSAVVAALASHALGPTNVLGVGLPSQFSSSHSLADAEALAKNLGISFRVAPIKMAFSTTLMELKPLFGQFEQLQSDVTEENMQARLRALFLMAIANKKNSLVLATSNKSEIAVGYCTIYGDMAGALAPIGDLYKTEVYKLAQWINFNWNGPIPSSSITKPPSAELKPNQKDQDTLPDYAILDALLKMYLEQGALESELLERFDSELVKNILRIVKSSEYKRRQAPPILKVSPKAFGIGRRVPIAKANS
ncbi:MAG: NAD+ synthase [Bacteriovoracia bacterium]